MTDRTQGRSEHDWFRARIVPHLLGLLDAETEQAFHAHAGACPACEAERRSFEAAPLERLRGRPHIPARLLARWDRTRERLRGVARELVRQHLEECEECRADLERIGHAPVLLESAETGPAMTLRPEGEPSHAETLVAASRYGVRSGRVRWVAIGAFAGALAACLALVPFLNRREEARVIEPATPVAPRAVAPSSSVELPSAATELGRLPDPIVLRAPSRGVTDSGDSPVVRDPGRVLVLQFPDLFLAPRARVRLTMLGPDAEVLARWDEEASSLARRGIVVIRGADSPWRPGNYQLEASPLADGDVPGPPLARFAFRIVRAER